MPSVSVVIPCFNRGHCIKTCIESVLSQSFQDLEVIVVDDGSEDDTRDQVFSLSDPRVRYIAHESNRGGAAARNTGIKASQSEFLAFLDSDDRWAPDKLQKQVQLFRTKGEDYGFSYTWLIGRDPDGEELWRLNRTIDGLAEEELLVENCVGTFSSVIARQTVLQAVGGLDEKMRSCQDWDLYVRLNAITKVCCVQEYLVYYQQNRGDKNRISVSPTSITLGRRRMLGKLQNRFPGMSMEGRVASLKGFVNDFVAAGATADVLRTGLRIVGIDRTFGSLVLLMQNFARAVKRNVTRDYGY